MVEKIYAEQVFLRNHDQFHCIMDHALLFLEVLPRHMRFSLILTFFGKKKRWGKEQIRHII
jgi:hypothetical protein